MSDVRWMTYADLASTLAIGPDSARNLVRRKRWARKPGNDGLARVGVPVDHLADHADRDGPPSPPSEGASQPHIEPPTHPPIVPEVIAVLSRHVDRLEAELAAVRSELASERARGASLAIEAAVAGALRDTVQALKSALHDEKARTIEVRADRDRWHRQATAPRGVFAWFRRAG